MACNATDPHIVLVPLEGAAEPDLDVDLRAAWRRDDRTPALHSVLDCLFTLEGDTEDAALAAASMSPWSHSYVTVIVDTPAVRTA